jgi:hypothetical protein
MTTSNKEVLSPTLCPRIRALADQLKLPIAALAGEVYSHHFLRRAD